MVTLASWNVNSIKARMGHLLEWLRSFAPEVVMLQELKCTEDNFPALEIKGLGYETAVVGQSAYNGVALLSKDRLSDVRRELPGDGQDSQARYLEATTFGLRVASIYLPNGNPPDSDKFTYKLAWMGRLEAQARSLLARELPTVLGGDYNVIPQPRDCYDPEVWKGDALFRPESRAAFRRILNLGYVDAFRALNDQPDSYTFWDYQGGAWAANNGIRIDHLLLSPQAADRLEASGIDRTPRSWDKASDHTPVWCRLRD